MNKFISLTKVLLKNSFSTFGTGKNKKLKSTAYVLLLFFSFVPIPVGIATFTSVMFDMLGPNNLILLQYGFTSIYLLLLVISIFFVISVFYFATDIDFLLPLPLKAGEIVSAKFVVTMIYLYFVVLLYSAPLVIVFGIKSSAGIFYYLFGLIILSFIPVIPLVITIIISMFLMRFVNLTKKKDQFRIIISIVGIGVILGLNYFTNNFLNSHNPQASLEMLRHGESSFIRISSTIFPSINYAVFSLSPYNNTNGFLYLNAYICVNIIFYLLFLKVSEKIYLRGAIGGSEVFSDSKKLSEDQFNSLSKQNKKIIAFAIKEVKILLRTPAFFLNCVLINFLWPIFLFIAFVNKSSELSSVLNFIKSDNSFIRFITIFFSTGMFISGSNAISASAISREGNTFFVCMYLPVKFSQQIIAKLLPGISVSSVVSIIIVLSAGLAAKLSFPFIIISLLFAIAGSSFASVIGLYIDIHFPKLIWDNEYKAVKQNMNVIVNLLINFIIALGLIITQTPFNLNPYLTLLIIIFILFIGIFLYINLISNSKKLFNSINS